MTLISAPVAVVWRVDVRPIVTQNKVLKSRDVLLSVEEETLPALVHTLYIISGYTVCVCVCAVDPACFVPFCSISLTIITRVNMIIAHSKQRRRRGRLTRH